MAQFRATIQGQRGEVSRLGSRKSGITARINGWHSGIRVEAFERNGLDCFDVYQTGGSTGGDSVYLGHLVGGKFLTPQHMCEAAAKIKGGINA